MWFILTSSSNSENSRNFMVQQLTRNVNGEKRKSCITGLFATCALQRHVCLAFVLVEGLIGLATNWLSSCPLIPL